MILDIKIIHTIIISIFLEKKQRNIFFVQCHIADVDRLRSRTWSCVPAQRHLRLHPKKSGSEPRVTICLARSGAVATQFQLSLSMDTPWDGPVKPCIPDVLLPAIYSPWSLPLTIQYLHSRSPKWPDDSWKPDYVPWQRTKTFSSGVLKPWWNGKQGFPYTSQGLTWEGHSYVYTSFSSAVWLSYTLFFVLVCLVKVLDIDNKVRY